MPASLKRSEKASMSADSSIGYSARSRGLPPASTMPMSKSLSGRASPRAREPNEFLGFRPFASRGGVVTNDLIDKLRNEED